MEDQDIDIVVVDDVKSQSKSYLYKVFIDVSGDSCIVFLCWIWTNEQGLFWMIGVL